jgi:P4 family phage/plasmid primase-like protien
VFPSVAVRRYFMDVMSEIFVGYNHRKHVYFWTGEGDNGKSITQMFFEKMLGALSVKTPTTLLTSRRSNTGSATAELVRLGNGVRATFLEEPDPDEEIATGVLKSLSGNDSFFARDLYQAGRDVREVQPMFKMFFICNSLPRMRRGGDKASWNRARVIPFDATFTKDAPPTIEEQLFHRKFPVDRTLDQRIPHLVEALAWILMEHRKLPRVEEPPEVLQATANYKNENDIIAYFMKEHMDEDPDSEICVGQMYEYYKEFSSRATLKFMNTMEFEKVMIKRLGPPNGHTDKSWTGYRMTAAKSSQLAPAAEEDRNVARALL